MMHWGLFNIFQTDSFQCVVCVIDKVLLKLLDYICGGCRSQLPHPCRWDPQEATGALVSLSSDSGNRPLALYHVDNPEHM